MKRPTTITVEPREERLTTRRYAVFAGDEEVRGVNVVRGPGYWAVLIGKTMRFELANKAAVMEVLREWCRPRGLAKG